jgi:hypothetical protein
VLSLGLTLLVSACAQAGSPSAEPSSAPGRSSAPSSASASSSPQASAPSSALNTPPANPSISERTPWQAEMANIQPDGSRSVESALRLFALAIADVPGFDATRSDPGEIKTGTPAIHAVRAHWNELTAEQQSAIEGALQPPDDAVRETVPEAQPGSVTGVAARFVAQGADATKIAAVRGQIDTLRSRLAAIWGDFPNEIEIVFINNDSAMASYASVNMSPGNPANFKCTIIIPPTGLNTSSATLHVSVAHDVFYCGAAYKRNSDDFYGVPHWVVDGMAHFFALSETGEHFENAWKLYMLQSDSIPLFERDFDAIGFWSHIQYRLGDAYSAFLAASAVPGASGASPARFEAAGGSTDDFLNTWASGLYREGLKNGPGFGPSWNTYGPSLPIDLQGTFEVLQVITNDVEVVERPAYTNIYYSIQTSADLLRFEFVGRPRLGDGKGVDTTLLASAVYCTRMGGCPPCPSAANPQQYPTLSQDSILAISGGMEGTTGTVSGEKLEPCPSPDVCEDGGNTVGGGPVAMIGGGMQLAQKTPCPTPTPDEFCKRWRALLDWQLANQSSELTQPWAAEIARQSQEMLPFAPPQLVDGVNAYIRAYGTFASAPEPMNVPMAGPDAALIGIAFMANNDYCGITF